MTGKNLGWETHQNTNTIVSSKANAKAFIAASSKSVVIYFGANCKFVPR